MPEPQPKRAASEAYTDPLDLKPNNSTKPMPYDEAGPPPYQPDAPITSLLADLMREYVAGGESPFLSAIKRALPQYIDDNTRDFGNDLYERMMRDSDVNEGMETVRLGILSQKVKFVPALPPKDAAAKGKPENAAYNARQERSQEWADFMQRAADAVATPFHAVCHEVLDGMFVGNKCAEKIAAVYTDGDDKGKIYYRDMKCRARKMLAFVIDAWGNHVGFLAVEPDKMFTSIQTSTLMGDPREYSNFIPRDKFLVFQWCPKNSDPRGTSLLEAAYNPWFFKTQIYPDYYSFLRRYGSGLLVGKSSKDSPALDYQTDTSGNRINDTSGNPVRITKEQALFNAMMVAQMGTVLAVPAGTEVDLLQLTGQGAHFTEALDYLGKQIVGAITKSARSNKESANNSQSDASAASDILGLIIYYGKILLGDVFTRDFCKPLMLANAPDDEQDLCPIAEFMAAEKADKADLLQAFATAGFTLHESQFPALDVELGLPERDLAAIAQEKEDAADAANQELQLKAGMMGPSGPPKAKAAA